MIDAPSDEDEEALRFSPPSPPRTTPALPSISSPFNGQKTHPVQTPNSLPGLNMTPRSRSAFEPYVLNHTNDSDRPNPAHAARSPAPSPQQHEPARPPPLVVRSFPAPPRTVSSLTRKAAYREQHLETAGTLHTCALDSPVSTRLRRGGSERPETRADFRGTRLYDPTAIFATQRDRAHTFEAGSWDQQSRERASRDGSDNYIMHPTSPPQPRRMTNFDESNAAVPNRASSASNNINVSSSLDLDNNIEEPNPTNNPLHHHQQRHGSNSAFRSTDILSTFSVISGSVASIRRVFGAFTVSLGRQQDCVTSPRRRAMRVAACIGLYFVAMGTFLYRPIPNESLFAHQNSYELSKISRKDSITSFNELEEKGGETSTGIGFGVGYGREVLFPPAGGTANGDSSGDDADVEASVPSKEIKAFVLRSKDDGSKKNSDQSGTENAPSNSLKLSNAAAVSSERHTSKGRRPSLSHAKASSSEVIFGAGPREVRLGPDGAGKSSASTSSKWIRFVPPKDGAQYLESGRRRERYGWTFRGLFGALAWVGLMVLVLETGCREVARRFMYVQHRSRRARTE